MCQGEFQCPFHEGMALPLDQPPDGVERDLWLRMLDNRPRGADRRLFAAGLRSEFRRKYHPLPQWVTKLMNDPERPPESLPAAWQLRARRASVGPRIRAARVASGVKQSDLAQSIGVSQPTISRIELGAQVPTMAQFVDIANALGASFADLLTKVERFEGVEPRGLAVPYS